MEDFGFTNIRFSLGKGSFPFLPKDLVPPLTLSICIPTYNRASFLEQAIESIFNQVDEKIKNRIEICISDNASKDDTMEIVYKYKKNAIVPIIYSRNEENIGPDRNFLKVIGLAQGDYCWFLGDDDVLTRGSISRIFKEIEMGYDIYLCNRIEHDLISNLKKRRFWLSNQEEDRVFNLSNRDDLLIYLRKATTLGALFSYISSIIFRRNKWQNVKYEDLFTGTGYAHVFMLLSFINQGCKLKYIQEPLVICRLGNPGFADEGGFAKRVMLDIKGYQLLSDRFFSKEPTIKEAFLEVLRRERPFHNIRIVRLNTNKEEWGSIEKILRKCNYNKIILFFTRYYNKQISIFLRGLKKIFKLLMLLIVALRYSLRKIKGEKE